MRRSLVAVGLALVAFVPACGDGDAEAYKRDNERLLASVPLYPGARETERHAEVRTEEEHDAGWTLRAIYALPAGATAEQVLTFYRNGMPGWTPDTECCKGLEIAQFHRGDELVTVNADNVEQPVHTYEIGVDARSTTDSGA